MAKPKTDDLIALICKAATEKYREDTWRPGIQIAHIPAEPKPAFWYVALHRYPNPPKGQRLHTDDLGRSLPPGCPAVRVVVHEAQHEDLDRAVQLLGLQLLPLDAQIELAQEMKGGQAVSGFVLDVNALAELHALDMNAREAMRFAEEHQKLLSAWRDVVYFMRRHEGDDHALVLTTSNAHWRLDLMCDEVTLYSEERLNYEAIPLPSLIASWCRTHEGT